MRHLPMMLLFPQLATMHNKTAEAIILKLNVD